MKFKTPLTLADSASSTKVRSRTRISSAPMIQSPLRMPATMDTAITVGVPRPRRLMMPAIPPT